MTTAQVSDLLSHVSILRAHLAVVHKLRADARALWWWRRPERKAEVLVDLENFAREVTYPLQLWITFFGLKSKQRGERLELTGHLASCLMNTCMLKVSLSTLNLFLLCLMTTARGLGHRHA